MLEDRPWRHLAALGVGAALVALLALATRTPAQDALIPGFVGVWAALMLQIAAGCYDRWL